MKTQVLYAIAVGLIGLACCLGNGSVGLPGDQIGEGELSKVWAARTNPSGAGSGQCVVSYPSDCATGGTVAVGDPCCGDQYGGLGNITCTGVATNQKFTGGTENCIIGSRTVAACAIVGTRFLCTGITTIKNVGTRNYCRAQNYNIVEH